MLWLVSSDHSFECPLEIKTPDVTVSLPSAGRLEGWVSSITLHTRDPCDGRRADGHRSRERDARLLAECLSSEKASRRRIFQAHVSRQLTGAACVRAALLPSL